MIWITIVGMGIVTFSLRASFVFLFTKPLKPELEAALRFVAPSVLAALILPMVFVRQGTVHLELSADMLCMIVGTAVAARSKSPMLTVLIGMAALHLAIALGF